MRASPIPPTAGPVRIFVVDDHPTIREALAAALDGVEDLEFCGAAGSASETLDLAVPAGPDVVLLDVLLGDGDGLELLARLRCVLPNVAVVLYSMLDESMLAVRALRAGALGYVMKTESLGTVLAALRSAARGEVYVSPAVRRRLVAGLGRREDPTREGILEALCEREMSVLLLVGQGMKTGEIGEFLALHAKSVEAIRRRIAGKLGLTGVASLVPWAILLVSGRPRPAMPPPSSVWPQPRRRVRRTA